MRIVSLVPSLTKTVCDLGLKDHMVGITNFCVDPPDLHRSAVRIGGTKDPDIERIYALDPTHIIVNQEENRADDIDALRKLGNVLLTFPKGPADVPVLLREMGEFLGCQVVAEQWASNLEQSFRGDFLTGLEPLRKGARFLYLIWREPWMAVSRDTYISRFLESFGMVNVLVSSDRYPVIDPGIVPEMNPDVILMSSEPWPFRKRDADAWRSVVKGCDRARLYWIDGKYCSWYGSMTRLALESAMADPRFTREM